MKIKYFGTAAAEGVPALFCDCDICEQTRRLGGKNIRTRSQALIDDELLIDFPADTYLHILRDGLPLHKIYNLIITHNHHDHFYPKDLHNRAHGFSNLKDDKPFNVYGTKATLETLWQSCGETVINNMIADNVITLNEISAFKPFEVTDYTVTPLKADHRAEDSVIYLIEKDGKTLLYGHDTGYFPSETIDYLEKNKKVLDYATFDCCFGLKFCRKNHMGIETVCEIRDDLKKKGIITEKTICCVNHFSHNVGPLYEDMRNHGEKLGFITSYDGMESEF